MYGISVSQTAGSCIFSIKLYCSTKAKKAISGLNNLAIKARTFSAFVFIKETERTTFNYNASSVFISINK